MKERESHKEQIVRWAKYIKSKPKEIWKPGFDDFINSQILMSRKIYLKLNETEIGRNKIKEIIKNKI